MEADDNSSLAESIVQYLERATIAESKVSALEERLAALEMTQVHAPPQMAYFAPGTQPEYAYFTPQPATFQPPPAVQIPTQQQMPQYQQPQQQWNPQGNYQQNKKPKRDFSGNPVPPTSFGGSPNIYPPQQQPFRGGGRGGRGGRGGGGRRNQNNANAPYSNTQKRYLNLFYCFTCGYDVDHEGHQCPYGIQGHHMPQVKRHNAHLFADRGACMRGQHKTLPDGSGAGQGWVLAQSVTKAQWTMQQQQPNNQQWQGRGQNTNQRYQQQSQWNGQNWNQNQHWKQS